MIETIVMELINDQAKSLRILYENNLDSPASSLVEQGNHDDAEADGETPPPSEVDVSSIVFLMGVFIFIFLFSVIKYWICEGPITRRQRRRAREARKRLIREQVVFKTVIKKEGMHEHADINEAESGETLSMGDEDHHETEATNTASRRTADDDEEEQGGFVHRYCRQKTNLEISTSQHNGDDGGNSRMECQICLADFEVGDKICWSNNPECVHTFHIGCLEPWLMKHDECPLCRCKYLVPQKKEPPSEMETYDPNAQRTSEITRRVVAVLSLLFFFRRITTVQQTRQDQNNDEEEIDRVPEISGEDQITINDDDNPPSPNMIPLEDVSDCSPTEEMVEPSDIERGDTTTSSR